MLLYLIYPNSNTRKRHETSYCVSCFEKIEKAKENSTDKNKKIKK